MTRWEWFESGYAVVGVELGIVSPDVFARYIRYKVYLDFMAAGHDKQTAIELAAEQNKCEASTIYRAISFFAKPCKETEVVKA